MKWVTWFSRFSSGGGEGIVVAKYPLHPPAHSVRLTFDLDAKYHAACSMGGAQSLAAMREVEQEKERLEGLLERERASVVALREETDAVKEVRCRINRRL